MIYIRAIRRPTQRLVARKPYRISYKSDTQPFRSDFDAGALSSRARISYARLAFTSATRMIKRLPSALAARVIESSVTDTFRGSSKRSSCDLLVRSCLAIVCFVFRCACMACSSCHASTRLMATASTSSRIPSSSRKLSNVEPLWFVLPRLFLTFIGVPFDACPYYSLPTLNHRSASFAFS